MVPKLLQVNITSVNSWLIKLQNIFLAFTKFQLIENNSVIIKQIFLKYKIIFHFFLYKNLNFNNVKRRERKKRENILILNFLNLQLLIFK